MPTGYPTSTVALSIHNLLAKQTGALGLDTILGTLRREWGEPSLDADEVEQAGRELVARGYAKVVGDGALDLVYRRKNGRGDVIHERNRDPNSDDFGWF